MVDNAQSLTNPQWQVIKPLLPTHRKRRHSLRQVLDAMLYACLTACQWRNLPTCFPPWSVVYYYFARWRTEGTFERLGQASNRADRLAQGRLPTPSLALGDAQRIKWALWVGQQRGLAAHKRLNERKRQVRCDTGGRLWRMVVHAANGHDGRGAQPLLPTGEQLRPAWASRLRSILPDKAYKGRFVRQVQALGWQHQLASGPPTAARVRAGGQALGRRTHLCLA